MKIKHTIHKVPTVKLEYKLERLEIGCRPYNFPCSDALAADVLAMLKQMDDLR